MVPYFVDVGEITLDDLAAFRAVCAAIQKLPYDNRLTCHAVARLVAHAAPGFRVVDGYFLHGYTHSWLRRAGTIIDPYPVAAANPLLVTARGSSPWQRLYNEAVRPKDIKLLAPSIRKAEALAAEIGTATAPT
jgi:hypothetical protein